MNQQLRPKNWDLKTEFSPLKDLNKALDSIIERGLVKKPRRDLWYYNSPNAFDIEATSFYNEGEKTSTMYVWQIGLNGYAFYGRTWEEFESLISYISDYLSLSKTRRLIIYIHNFSYEFAFICKRFKYETVFSLDSRKPCYAVTDFGIEFRCSYILSNYSLSKLSTQLTKYKVEKMVGDLDYNKIRHTKTPLTKKELKYCLYDVLVVMAYIQEKIENDGDITKIPLTNTGYVRNYCRNACFNGVGSTPKEKKYEYRKYRQIMNALQMKSDEFEMLHRAFMGGFTHANCLASTCVLNDVTSFDFCSAYPAMLISKEYPMSRGEEITIKNTEELIFNLERYCCVFDVEFINLKPKIYYENPLSVSKCYIKENVVNNNGRVVSADRVATTITEQDFIVFKEFYHWDNLKVGKFIRYKRGYLPTNFVKSIIKLYKDKTELKDVDDKIVEYLISKGMLNSAYGMCVTNPCKNEITFDGEWGEKEIDLEESIEHYNNSKNRFLFYAWGVWCTAYCRTALFSGIYACGSDYVYADTDSIKITNKKEHLSYIKRYNKTITDELKEALNFHKIPYSEIKPKTVGGVEKPLGIWEEEYTAEKFKTLGAKRYLYLYDGKYKLTVAGVGKDSALEYILKKSQNDPFKIFDDDLYIPKEYSGKTTHSYIEHDQDGVITDYLGNTTEFHEKGGVHIEECEYSLSITEEYKNLILNMKEFDCI